MKTNNELIEEFNHRFYHERHLEDDGGINADEWLRTTLTQRDAEVAEAINEALLTKTQYAEIAKGWGAEGSDRYEGYIQGQWM